MVNVLRGIEKALVEDLAAFNTFCITILIGCLIVFLARSYPSPFYGPTTSEWWTLSLDGKTRIEKPAIMFAQDGHILPVGRTLCLDRQIYAHIYKELDAANSEWQRTGRTWPMPDPGGGDRVLQPGCQDRISPSTLPLPGPSAPPPGNYLLNVYFIVPRNPFIDLITDGPLIVTLHLVKVQVVAGEGS